MSDPLDALFTATPQEFVARRNELAASLRKQKRRDEAAEVASLRRPTAPLWALNQLARQHPDDVAQLLEAGADLPAAQDALLAGDQDRFRAAVGRHRDLVSRLARLGAQLVADAEVSATDQRQDIATELQAASTTPEAAEPFRRGRLADRPSELGQPDTGLLGALTATATPTGRPSRRTGPSRSGGGRSRRDTAGDRADRAGGERAEQERAEQERAEQQRAERERAAARAAVAAAEAAVRRATDEHQELAGEVADLEADLERARQRLQAAAERRSEAEDELADAERVRRALG